MTSSYKFERTTIEGVGIPLPRLMHDFESRYEGLSFLFGLSLGAFFFFFLPPSGDFKGPTDVGSESCVV